MRKNVAHFLPHDNTSQILITFLCLEINFTFPRLMKERCIENITGVVVNQTAILVLILRTSAKRNSLQLSKNLNRGE
eukprot:snap_masked-scaffold_22-processed-gene-4.27-mRNA-1 protein AED:1.00 eAED:1.00 QI:0/0/0/0/1/1/2/0/76